MKIVSDTGPIIGLAKIGKLNLIRVLFEDIVIPPFVYKELFGKIGQESEEIERALNSFITVAEFPAVDPETEKIIYDLDEGEKQAVALAFKMCENEKVLLLLDDCIGGRAAAKLKIPTTGVVGLLLQAKEKGYVKNVGSVLIELRRNGYWLSDQIIKIAKRLAGEKTNYKA